MNSNPPLAGSHLRTYQTIFRHPASHNLGWHDVHALFRHLGSIEEEANGNFKVTRNGHSIVLPPPRTKDVAETDELMALRRFLERSETPAVEAANQSEGHWILVINQHEARIFRTAMNGFVPQRILPHRPEDFFRRAANPADLSGGQEKPDPSIFFGPVADGLEAAERILVFGGGAGMASEMDKFVAWLGVHRPKLAQRVIGSMVVDEHDLTDAQLVAKAQAFYANRGKAG